MNEASLNLGSAERGERTAAGSYLKTHVETTALLRHRRWIRYLAVRGYNDPSAGGKDSHRH